MKSLFKKDAHGEGVTTYDFLPLSQVSIYAQNTMFANDFAVLSGYKLLPSKIFKTLEEAKEYILSLAIIHLTHLR